MIVCESILMSILVIFGSYMAYTDIKRGVIENKVLIKATLIGILVNLIYFIFFATDYLRIYLSNILFMTIIAFLFYICHFWAAGDSKLLICINLLFPARFYDYDSNAIAPGINGVIYIFLLAYLYIIFESLYLAVKKEKFYSNRIKVSTQT